MHSELIDVMGDDIRVVNAARVSFDKESDWDIVNDFIDHPTKPDQYELVIDKELLEKDQKLLNYLAKHNHWTPFSHVMITMRETVPIFVARQRFKHVVGFTYNEVSRRYVDDAPKFFKPDGWRKAAENKKQGSSDELINDNHTSLEYDNFIQDAIRIYTDMIEKDGIAPEQARMVLPQSMYTSYYVTGSLAAWARAYKLRIDPHAQKEIQDLAKQWGDIIGNIDELRYSWNALVS
jgi:thymidylate synthase (FAD)